MHAVSDQDSRSSNDVADGVATLPVGVLWERVVGDSSSISVFFKFLYRIVHTAAFEVRGVGEVLSLEVELSKFRGCG
jgi:hypothetical protein